MEAFLPFLNMHRGLGYSTLIIYSMFLYLLISTMLSYSGKISTLLRKASFFSMMLIHVQVCIGLIMLFFLSPGFQAAKDSGILMSDKYARTTYIEHPTAMIICAILMTIVNKFLKKNEVLQLKYSIMALVSVLFFQYGFPFAKLFGGLLN